ncbi:MAG: hypothetical protein GKS06_13130 [Acidobacteria bacterium]|nr:hypothetical protein [Acidobacteriota bacterium]
MTVATDTTLRIARTIKADRQRVWDAWTQPEHMKKWCCPQPGGVHDVSADFEVGGAYEIVMKVDGDTHTAFGTYREIDAPSRLVYTWDWREEDNQMGDTTVTVEFNEVDGGTEVIIVQDGFPAAEATAAHEEGWGACISHFEGLFS